MPNYLIFETVIKATIHEKLEAEYKFHPVRKWRFDYAIPDLMIAIEIEGGSWVQGRHTRGKGYQGDMEKYNTAQLMGWKVLRYTPEQAGECARDLEIIKRSIK